MILVNECQVWSRPERRSRAESLGRAGPGYFHSQIAVVLSPCASTSNS